MSRDVQFFLGGVILATALPCICVMQPLKLTLPASHIVLLRIAISSMFLGLAWYYQRRRFNGLRTCA